MQNKKSAVCVALLIIGWIGIVAGVIAFIVLLNDGFDIAALGFMIGGSSVISGMLFLAAAEALNLLQDIRDSLTRAVINTAAKADKKEKNTFGDLPKL